MGQNLVSTPVYKDNIVDTMILSVDGDGNVVDEIVQAMTEF